MNRLKRCTFWNVHIKDDGEIIQSVINKWGLLFVLEKPGVGEIKTMINFFKEFTQSVFDPERLTNYTFDSPDIQKDWIVMRKVIIRNFYNSFPNNSKPLGKVNDKNYQI